MIKTLTFNINFPFTGKTKATITVAFCIFVPLNPSKTSFQNDIQPSCFKFGDSKNGMQILRRHMRVKDGRQNNGRQRYKCKSCHRKQQALYSYNAYQKGINNAIITLTKEGVGIRSAARILDISPTTLLSRIVQIAQTISRPPVLTQRTYEVDEIKSFVRRKSEHIWIAYALDRKSKQVVSYNIGPRTNATLNVVLETLRLSDAKRVYTDRLRNYRSLIETKIYRTSLIRDQSYRTT